MTSWTLATRGSALALRQAEMVRSALHAQRPDIDVRLEIIQSTGDIRRDAPLARIGATGLFTKEVDERVLDGGARLAVHSLKDVPTELPQRVHIAAILEREDPRDAWVAAPGAPANPAAAQSGARVGTSSLRRRALLLAARPDLVVEDLRGNLDTRLERVRNADFDAIVVALAGLRRLGRDHDGATPLGPPDWLPAAGQGALAVVVAAEDEEAATVIGALDHADTASAVAAERALLRRLEGGCQIPIGAFATVDDDRLELAAVVADLDGRRVVRGTRSGSVESAEAIGLALADEMIAHGANAIVDAIREATGNTVPGAGAP